MAVPEEDGTVEQEKKLQFDDMNDALVYIVGKNGVIEEIGKATQREIVLLRKDFLPLKASCECKFMFPARRKILPLILSVLIVLATCVAALLTSETRIRARRDSLNSSF
jgi:hypothetical protein